MTALVAVVAGVLGLAAGSFVNVVAHRVPQRISLVAPRSRCPACQVPIRPADNVPVVSWLLLRGHCRACGARISARYPLVEALTAGLFVALALRFEGLELAPYAIGVAGLVALSLIDLDTQLLPKRVVWPVAGVVAAGFLLTAVVEDRFDDVQRALLGAAVTGGTLWAIWFVSGFFADAFGYGDVRLGLLLGLLTGWVDRGTVLAGFALAFLTSGVFSVALLLARRKGRKDVIPFGPWLVLGCILALLWPASGRWLEENQIQPTIESFKLLF